MEYHAVRKIIEQNTFEFSEAMARGDYAGMAAHYAENAKVLPPDCPIVTGRKAIEEFWRAAANALKLIGSKLTIVDLEVVGDAAYAVGEATLKLATGKANIKYLVVWREGRDGRWRLHRDIWNGLPAGMTSDPSGERQQELA